MIFGHPTPFEHLFEYSGNALIFANPKVETKILLNPPSPS